MMKGYSSFFEHSEFLIIEVREKNRGHELSLMTKPEIHGRNEDKNGRKVKRHKKN